ncbi:TadE/TadG family type IV pilus assembly protein [Melghirimyces algeriensis]|uniref:Flp pilus-assembly TadE/G-like n=1 Tax=Melghirimyces algeriensis TaxID=910412 RepID=A0A521E948_9BACL|nr:Tad domain-containing protein [Melghirimyces algeriensis]SMO80429.1 Putative Flp pilus-assembly TadE/G-like [Melghirimyces algeriensis]
MFSIYRVLRRRRGNVTTFWVAGLPVFMMMFMFLASMAVVWMTQSTSQVAADAASLAVTKKLDQIVEEEKQQQMAAVARRNEGKEPGDPGYIDPYYAVLGTEQKRQSFMERVVYGHKAELIATVRSYAKKNGGGKHGVIRLSVHDRVEVVVKTKFEPPIFKEDFKNTDVHGNGTGPRREYIAWTEEGSIEVKY